MTRKAWTLLIAALPLLLAGCGGGDDSTPVPPTPTPEPTLTVEERVQFSPGSVENPLRFVINPVDAVAPQVIAIVTEITGDDIDAEDDIEGMDPAALNAALEATFGVTLGTDAIEGVETAGDLSGLVSAAIGDRFEDIVYDRSSLSFEVVLVDTYAQGLSDLCNSGEGLVSIAWLDGMTYAAALAQNCGQPGLRVGVIGGGYGLPESLLALPDAPAPEATPEVTAEATAEATGEATAEATAEITAEPTEEPTQEATLEPEETQEATPELTPEATPEVTAVPVPLSPEDVRTGTEGLILLDRSLGATSLDALRGRTFCRLGPDDFFSWFLPALVMDGRAIDPVQDTGAIVDYGSLRGLLMAAADGDCAGIGISNDAYERFQADLPEVADAVVISNITPAFPYPVMLYPLEVELGVRLTLDELLVELADEDEAGSVLGWLLGQDVLLTADEEDFTGLLSYLQAFGLNLARLGN